LNAFIVRTNEAHYFILDFPHIVIDWLSLCVLMKDLNALLNQKTLPNVEDSFKIYESNLPLSIAPAKNFRHRTLTLPPQDYLAPFSAIGGSEILFLGSASTYQAFCERNKMSVHTFFALCHTLLLWKLTKSSPVSFYVPVMGRNTRTPHGQVGCFVQTAIFEVSVADHLSLHSLLDAIKEKLLEIGSEDCPSVNSIGSGTLLNFHFPEVNRLSFGELDSERVFIKKRSTICDIVFEIEKHNDQFLIYSTFSTSRYKPSTIKSVLDTYREICRQVLKLDLRKDSIGEISALGKTALKSISASNATKKAFQQNVLLNERVDAALEKYRDETCVVHGGKSYTYRELGNFSNAVAHVLKRAEIPKNTPIAIFSERSFELIACLCGVLKSGGAFVPFSVDWPIERLISTLKEHGISHLITQKKFAHCFSNLSESVNIVYLDSIDLDACPKRSLSVTRSSQDAAYIIFTSGTTGQPKGVTISHRAVGNLLDWGIRKFNLTQKDNCLWVCSISFDLSIFDIFAMLSVGGKITLTSDTERKNIQSLAHLLLQHNITIWNSAPPVLTSLVRYLEILDVQTLPLRLILLSGDWIPTELPGRIEKICNKAKIYSLGGATEATVWSNYHLVTGDSTKCPSIPYGKPIQNSKYYILDEKMALCPPMIPGELCISGVCLADGYYNQPEATDERFRIANIEGEQVRVYRTGDLAFFHADGEIRLLGRMDHQVKIRGHRVELNEIKICLRDKCGVIESEVVPYKQHAQTVLIAFLVCQETEKDTEYFQHKLRMHLPDYMLPKHLIILPKMPVTQNGKIDRDALHKMIILPPQIDASKKEIDLTSYTHRKIYEAFKKTLHSEKIPLDESFFDLGGNSLSAFEVFVTLRRDFILDLQDLYEHPSINSLAEALKPKTSSEVQTRLGRCKTYS
jgi:amino acid adenylation domain-containing protein